MIKSIVANEWLQWRRDSRMKWMLIFLLLISAIALWHQVSFQSRLSDIRVNAQEDSRKEWLSQELKHPHMAAHFGNYAYKTPSMLHCFDPGLTIYTGTSVYMEPHRQNDFLFSKSQESDTGSRFGWLSPALICQLILPLLIILFSFNSINGEREKGTLPLLLTQGVSFRRILFTKAFAVFIIFEIFLTLYFSITVLVSSLFVKANLNIVSIVYVWFAYTIYCFCWSLIGVLVSAKIKNTGSSIAILLLAWMLTNIIVPRISANVAENVYPLITNYEFKKQIAEAIEKGLDGHDSNSDRAMRIEKELLAKYKVDSVQQLPFNFEGYIMQQSEDYSSKVYDFHFNTMFDALKNQKQIQSWFSLISPYIAVRNLSMAGSNASLESEIDFQQQAEYYRRDFVQNMNNDMKDNSSYGSFETYRVKDGKYAAIGDLQTGNRSLVWSFPHIVTENILLLVWALALIIIMFQAGRKPIYS